MTTFFLDLWQDLREKRLWPVAAGLAVAIVALPVALVKPASSPSPSSAPPSEPQAAKLPAVSLDQGFELSARCGREHHVLDTGQHRERGLGACGHGPALRPVLAR